MLRLCIESLRRFTTIPCELWVVDNCVAALNAYRAGERTHPTMRAQGESLSDQDIADIAAYVSTAD